MRIDKVLNFDDLRVLAKRRLPKIVFDFVDGGADDELCLMRNRGAYQKHRLMPRYLVDVTELDQSVELFGKRYDSPFGICPMGLVGLAHPGADVILARAAAKANVPYLMSNASNDSIEAAAKVAPHNTWFQVYTTIDERINVDMIKRARDLSLETLVVTVDVPTVPNRERNRRNGFSRPLKMTASVMLESMLHPAWVLRFLMTGGIPVMENYAPYVPAGMSKAGAADLYGSLTPAAATTWKLIEKVRAQWPGNLVLKGILSPDDALQAVELGVNGLILSNHGGRQLDTAPSPIEVLPAVKAAIGTRAEILLDSGVRRGSDIVIAMALGARCTLFGRPMVYAVVAGGAAGADKALAMMRREVHLTMGQCGITRLAVIGPEALWRHPA